MWCGAHVAQEPQAMSLCSRCPACGSLLCRSAGTSGARAEQPAAKLATSSPSSKRRPPARRPERAQGHTPSKPKCGCLSRETCPLASLSCGSMVVQLRRRTCAPNAILGQLFGAAPRGRRGAPRIGSRRTALLALLTGRPWRLRSRPPRQFGAAQPRWLCAARGTPRAC